MRWTIEYYTTREGKSPVRDFIDALSAESQAKYIFITDLLEGYGILVREPYVKAVKGQKKLFEIRIKDKANVHRIFYFTFASRTLVLLHGFTKKEEKTPAREIETAAARMQDYLSRR
jgi:phage-related protein